MLAYFNNERDHERITILQPQTETSDLVCHVSLKWLSKNFANCNSDLPDGWLNVKMVHPTCWRVFLGAVKGRVRFHELQAFGDNSLYSKVNQRKDPDISSKSHKKTQVGDVSIRSCMHRYGSMHIYDRSRQSDARYHFWPCSLVLSARNCTSQYI